MPRQTKFPTIPLDRIRHILDQAEKLDAEDAAEICLNCGHPASDHNGEDNACQHRMTQHGVATTCNCEGWREHEPAKGPPS